MLGQIPPPPIRLLISENSEDDLIFYVNLISISCKLNVWIKISDIKHWLDHGNERELK